MFDELLSKLRHHRLYRQHELVYGTKDVPRLAEISSPAEEMPKLTSKSLVCLTCNVDEKLEKRNRSTKFSIC